jgi:glycosyltransferase involved in cell wall biosynthesis
LSGQISSLVGLARFLRARGHAVEVVTSFSQDALLDPDRAFAPEAGGGMLAARLLGWGPVVRRLRAAAADADVVQVNLPTIGFAAVGDLIQRQLGRPVVVGFEMHLPRLADLLGPHLLRHPGYYLPQLVANNSLVAGLSRFEAAHYIVASRLQAAELKRHGVGAGRISVIPNLVDPDHLNPDAPFEHPLWPTAGPVLTYVGHFNHVKGVDVLARALPAVLEEFPAAQLVLAWSGLGGWGPVARAIAEGGVADHVRVLGRVPVGAALGRSDLCVLPYRRTFGQAAYPDLLLEALSVGVPLVTSDLPLLRELLDPGWEAELARPDDPRDLARAILAVLRDRDYRRAMVARQAALVRTIYDPREIASRYEEAYGAGARALSRGAWRVGRVRARNESGAGTTPGSSFRAGD